jgi:hypothetical protein
MKMDLLKNFYKKKIQLGYKWNTEIIIGVLNETIPGAPRIAR